MENVEDMELNVQEIKELLDKLYDLKSKNTREINFYRGIIVSINKDTNLKKDELNDKLSKYRIFRIVNFLSFVLAFYTNNVISKYINSRILDDIRRNILELMELIIYFIPVIAVFDTETRNRDLKEEIKTKKDEFKLSRAKLHKYKIKYRNLIMENRTIEEMILSCYTRMNDLKDRKIF